MATQQKQNETLPAKRTFEVKYQAGDIEIILTPDIVKNYLIRGKKELATMQELVFFMGLCRARGMNPFAGDCYPIKYTQDDPMAMVVAIDFKRARANSQSNCRGWRKGVVVQKADGSLRDSAGLVLDGEKLVGGWFEATPEGWNVPFRLEVNLNGYIKKTREGQTTKFWKPENQATMIAKVAEGQGLSAVWSRDLGKLYTAEEMGVDEIPPPTFDIGPGGEVLGSLDLFMEKAKEQTAGDSKKQAALFRYVTANAAHYKTTEDQVKIDASLQFEKFWAGFEQWSAKQAPQINGKAGNKAPEAGTGNGKGQGDSSSQGQPGGQEEDTRPDDIQIQCPKEPSETFALKYCRDMCISSQDCEAWGPGKEG